MEEFKKMIMKYSYYDEDHKKITILDEDKLKEIFKSDEVKFKEEYHKEKRD